MNKNKIFLFTLMLSTPIWTGALFYQSYLTVIKKDINIILVKGSGKLLYRQYVPFKKGVSAIDVIKKLLINSNNFKNIYIYRERKWRKIKYDTKINQKTTIKIK